MVRRAMPLAVATSLSALAQAEAAPTTRIGLDRPDRP